MNKMVDKAADTVRQLVVAMVEKAKSGHPGGAMGGADFLTVLFTEFLNFDPDDPQWINRDRFFLDPGHMSPMLYATLTLFSKFTKVTQIFANLGGTDAQMLAQLVAGGDVLARCQQNF